MTTFTFGHQESLGGDHQRSRELQAVLDWIVRARKSSRDGLVLRLLDEFEAKVLSNLDQGHSGWVAVLVEDVSDR